MKRPKKAEEKHKKPKCSDTSLYYLCSYSSLWYRYFEKKKDKQKHKKNQQGYELPTDHAKEMFEGAEFIPFGERVDEPPKLPNPCKKRKQLH